MSDIFTIGHSTYSIEHFVRMLSDARITAIADVRSSPWSRHNPQFNRADLRSSLQSAGIDYRFYGKQLGGRPTDPSLFHGSTADYELMARTSEFAEGLEMIVSGAAKHRLALMCSEHNPLDCHRCLLVGRALTDCGRAVNHIVSDGEIVSQQQVEDKLLAMSGREDDDFFVPRSERLNAAYRDRSLRVAYTVRLSGQLDDNEFPDVKYG
jgi:uncharacterized protein (DUF488 family)